MLAFQIPELIAVHILVSLGTNSSMFANRSSFGDVRGVRCSVLGLKGMFVEVRSSVLMFGEHLRTFRGHKTYHFLPNLTGLLETIL